MRQRKPMNLQCPVCLEQYTESQWRKTVAGGYRAFRHFDNRGARWCNGKTGQHFAMIFTAGK